MSNGVDATLKPRLCHVIKWSDFNGYGFNLHAEKGKAGQYIGKVDEDSPASASGLKTGDRIVEIEGTNIGNENHQQVVGRIKAAGDEVQLLVVDSETDQFYKNEKRVVKGDLEEVVYIATPRRDVKDEVEEPIKEEYTSEVEEPAPATPEPEPEPEPEPAPVENDVHVTTEDTSNDVYSMHRIRLCHMVKRADFQGYGFNLHAERDKPGQYIGKIDDDSPAFHADLHEGDRIVEVNGENIESKGHQEVISMIKSGGEETTMLVVDHDADAYYSSKNITVNHEMANVDYKCSRDMAVQSEDIELPPSMPVFTLQADEDDVGTHDEVTAEPVQDEIAAESVDVTEELPPAPTDDLPEVTITAANDDPSFEAEFQADEPTVDEDLVDEPRVEVEVKPDITENGDAVEFTHSNEIVESNETSLPEAEDVRAESPQEPDQVVPEPVVNEPEPVVTEQEDTSKTVNGQASYVENTQNEVSSQLEQTPEPVSQKQNGDILVLSAKEYRERLSTKKKQDPRSGKMDFRSKYDMFQQM